MLKAIEVEQLNEVNSCFFRGLGDMQDVPVYQCNPQDTAEIAFLLFRNGYQVYAPHFFTRVRKSRHCKGKVTVAMLCFSGYLFVAGESPVHDFSHRVSRLKFGDMFATIPVETLREFSA